MLAPDKIGRIVARIERSEIRGRSVNDSGSRVK